MHPALTLRTIKGGIMGAARITAFMLVGLLGTVQSGWACSPAWNGSLNDITTLDDAPSDDLPAPRIVRVDAWKTEDSGCDSCGGTEKAEFDITADGGERAIGIQFEFPTDARPR
jgi:hypothetical protein